MNQQNSLTSNMTEHQLASIKAIAASEMARGEHIPVREAMTRQADNLSALHRSLQALEDRLYGVLTPNYTEEGLKEAGVDREDQPKSPLLREIEGANQRIAIAIDQIESITRRLEV